MKAYVLKFMNDNHVRNTSKAFGMAFHEDYDKVTWFAKSRSTIFLDFFEDDVHGLVVHPWLAKKILRVPADLIKTLQEDDHLVFVEMKVDFDAEMVGKDGKKILHKSKTTEGTVWVDPLA